MQKSTFEKCLALVRTPLYVLFYFASKLTSQKEISVLTYHSIDSNKDFYSVTPEEFRRQVEYLRENYKIVSLDEMVDYAKGKRMLPKKAVAITFDDGYHDFYLNVYPFFRRNKLPATVFATTGYVGKEWPLNKFHPKMLTWQEIEEISMYNITIGAHTVNHLDLQKTNNKEAKYEILKSREEIEGHIGSEVKFFSYPFGRYTSETLDVITSLGFSAGFGKTGTLRKTSEIFTLNRIQVHGAISFMLFKIRLTKAIDWLSKIEQTMSQLLKKLGVTIRYSSTKSTW